MSTLKWSVVKVRRNLFVLSVEGEPSGEFGYTKRICYQLAAILGLNPSLEIKVTA